MGGGKFLGFFVYRYVVSFSIRIESQCNFILNNIHGSTLIFKTPTKMHCIIIHIFLEMSKVI
ncbi:hypothetical protein Hanom_Chr02g00129021 [Helianthus anomalus]